MDIERILEELRKLGVLFTGREHSLSGSGLTKDPFIVVIQLKQNVNFNNYGTITGNVTIQNILRQLTEQPATAEIGKVFAELLNALQNSTEISNLYDRKALVGAAEDMAAEAAKPPAERKTSTLVAAWKYLTEGISAAKGLGELAKQWGTWGKAIGDFFNGPAALPLLSV